MRISDWSSDVCSSDLPDVIPGMLSEIVWTGDDSGFLYGIAKAQWRTDNARLHRLGTVPVEDVELYSEADEDNRDGVSETQRAEEHTSEFQSLMRILYAVFSLKTNNTQAEIKTITTL